DERQPVVARAHRAGDVVDDDDSVADAGLEELCGRVALEGLEGPAMRFVDPSVLDHPTRRGDAHRAVAVVDDGLAAHLKRSTRSRAMPVSRSHVMTPMPLRASGGRSTSGRTTRPSARKESVRPRRTNRNTCSGAFRSSIVA